MQVLQQREVTLSQQVVVKLLAVVALLGPLSELAVGLQQVLEDFVGKQGAVSLSKRCTAYCSGRPVDASKPVRQRCMSATNEAQAASQHVWSQVSGRQREEAGGCPRGSTIRGEPGTEGEGTLSLSST